MAERHSADNKILLGFSKNGKRVWYDSISSHAATHIKDTPNLARLASEVIRNADLIGHYMQFHTDMGREVGTSDLVDIEDGDKIIYAKRINRNTYTVFDLTKEPQPSSLVTTAFEAKENATYELVSAWIGPSDSPSLPGTEKETTESKGFWSTHALAWGSQEIQPASEITTCPW